MPDIYFGHSSGQIANNDLRGIGAGFWRPSNATGIADDEAIHLNPPGASGLARCGRKLAKVMHREDIADVTCNQCLRLEAHRVTWAASGHG